MSAPAAIRLLEPHEVDVYREIRKEALTTDSDAFGETIDVFEARSESELAEWLEGHAGRPDAGILIAEVDGRPVAMCGFGRRDDDHGVGFIWGMFVSRRARGMGIGGGLLESARERLEEAGVTRITARVAAPNEGAIEFYRAEGFAIGAPMGTLRGGSDVPVYEITAMLEEMPPFDPDPEYRISADEREALAPWVSVRAAERYLAAIPEKLRATAVESLGLMGGNEHNYNVQQLLPSGHTGWDRAAWDLYEDLRAQGRIPEDFPFPKPLTPPGDDSS